MPYVTALLSLLVRLLRPTRGAHTTAFGYLRELGGEMRRRRSRRVRRYVVAPTDLTTAHLPDPEPLPPTPPVPASPIPAPPIPAPRRPIEDAHPQVDIVRGPYRAWEIQRAFLQGVPA